MHAPVALLTAAAVLLQCAYASNHTNFSEGVIDRALSYVFGSTEDPKWIRMKECAINAGPTICLRAFTAWRADHALDSNSRAKSVFDEDLKTFPWQKYTNLTDDVIETKLCDSTVRLLQHRPLVLNSLPGYRVQLEARSSGSINVDIYKSSDEARGSMKKLRKRFLAYLPILLLPGLFMAAIIPFILPPLKMLTVLATLINNMALTGSIFTLLRNNAFNDKYEKKVIYVNAGYKNEKRRPYKGDESVIHTHTIDDDNFYLDSNNDGYEYSGSNRYEHIEEPPSAWMHKPFEEDGEYEAAPRPNMKNRRLIHKNNNIPIY